MNYVFTFLFCFIIWHLLYSIIVIYRKKGLEKFKESKQLLYFKQAYNIDVNKIDIKKFATKLSLVNGFIIATVVTIISLFDSLLIKLVVGFIILLPLMILMYTILGKSYQKKGGK